MINPKKSPSASVDVDAVCEAYGVDRETVIEKLQKLDEFFEAVDPEMMQSQYTRGVESVLTYLDAYTRSPHMSILKLGHTDPMLTIHVLTITLVAWAQMLTAGDELGSEDDDSMPPVGDMVRATLMAAGVIPTDEAWLDSTGFTSES